MMVNTLADNQKAPSLRDIRQMRALFERIALRIDVTRAEDSSLFAIPHQEIEDLSPSEQNSSFSCQRHRQFMSIWFQNWAFLVSNSYFVIQKRVGLFYR